MSRRDAQEFDPAPYGEPIEPDANDYTDQGSAANVAEDVQQTLTMTGTGESNHA